MSAYRLNVPTKRGSVLNGVLFRSDDAKAKTALIAITGIHGNFYSNPFYYNFGDTLNAAGMDFIYAQTNDAFKRNMKATAPLFLPGTHSARTGLGAVYCGYRS